MVDNQTIKERLILFIKHLSIGQGKFESRVGLSNGYVNNIRKSIQPDKLQKIALCYTELNTGWLMTGEGEMIKSDIKNASNSMVNNHLSGGSNISYNSNNNQTEYMPIMPDPDNSKDASIELLQKEVGHLNQTIVHLKDTVERQDKTITLLTSLLSK